MLDEEHSARDEVVIGAAASAMPRS